MKSKCCGANLVTSSSREGTSFYTCVHCGQPTDPACDHGDHMVCNECTEYDQLHADDYVDKNFESGQHKCPVCGTESSFGMMHWCKNGRHALHDGSDYEDFCVDVKPYTGTKAPHVLPDHLFCKCENGRPCFDTEVEIEKYIQGERNRSYQQGYNDALKGSNATN